MKPLNLEQSQKRPGHSKSTSPHLYKPLCARVYVCPLVCLSQKYSISPSPNYVYLSPTHLVFFCPPLRRSPLCFFPSSSLICSFPPNVRFFAPLCIASFYNTNLTILETGAEDFRWRCPCFDFWGYFDVWGFLLKLSIVLVFHWRLSSNKSCLPLNVVFHQRLPSFNCFISSMVVFQQDPCWKTTIDMMSSIKCCLLSKGVFHPNYRHVVHSILVKFRWGLFLLLLLPSKSKVNSWSQLFSENLA